jgi:hypothetical protein
VRNVGKPKVSQELVTFVGLLRIRKRLTSNVIYYVVIAVGPMDNPHVGTILVSGLNISRWRFLHDSIADIDAEVLGHPPKMLSLE